MKKNKFYCFLLFLIFNIPAFTVAFLLIKKDSQWCILLHKSVWMSNNWVFGVILFAIMFYFSFYITKLSFIHNFLVKKIWRLYAGQSILIASGSYFFFNLHLIKFRLVILFWLLVGYFAFRYLRKVEQYTLFNMDYNNHKF